MKTKEKTYEITALDGRSLRACKRIATGIFDENSNKGRAIQGFSSPGQTGYLVLRKNIENTTYRWPRIVVSIVVQLFLMWLLRCLFGS